MESLDLKQTFMIALIVAVILELFDVFFRYQSFFLDKLDKELLIIDTRLLFLLALIGIILLLIGYYPYLINLKEKELIKTFRKYGLIIFLLSMFIIFTVYLFMPLSI